MRKATTVTLLAPSFGVQLGGCNVLAIATADWPKSSDSISLAVSPPKKGQQSRAQNVAVNTRHNFVSASVCLRNAASPGEQY